MNAVGPIEPTDPRWDAYVRAHPRATLYQLGAWARILGDAYRFQPRFLALADDGVLHGVLPLLYKKGLISNARVRSLPVFPAGGPLADTREQEIALVDAARDAAREDGAVLAVISPTDYEQDLPDFVTDRLPPRWMLQVPADPDELRSGWRKTSNNLFRSLKKADKNGFSFRATDERRDLRAFYRLYLRTMKKHRTLPRSLRQLELSREALGPGEFRLFVVERKGEIAAGGVFHVFGDAVELIYNGSDDAMLDLRPNHALYWNVIRWAAEHGHHTFDFGEASPTTSLGRFKAQWAEPVPNYRYTWRAGEKPSRAESMAAASYEVEQGGGGLTAAAWRRAPLSLTRLGATLAYRYL
jgi:lipid II:glycine glycyltransferase (peptidoglycan interpeptide bridge formation enzyme)